ncbi:MAG: hypothetical protein OEZ24_05450, partial [Candidatus Bathyarchaeota archaeon]|nr:hypothetical protein [Candidatus Bathyarchaeota archaeon]
TFTEKIEIATKRFILDPNRVFEVRYYWLSTQNEGLPNGEYVATLVYAEDTNLHPVTERTCGYRSISSDTPGSLRTMPIRELEPLWVTIIQIQPNKYPGIITIEVFLPDLVEWEWLEDVEGRGIVLPKAHKNEYAFKLTVYTNSSVGEDELPARFVLIHKDAPFIGNLRVDSLTISGGPVLLSLILLIASVRDRIRISGKQERQY